MASTKKWYDYIPHSLVMVFAIIVLTGLMSYFVPAGAFNRIMIDGRERVVAGTYHRISQTPLSLLQLFCAFL